MPEISREPTFFEFSPEILFGAIMEMTAGI